MISPGGLEEYFEEGGELARTNSLPPRAKALSDMEKLFLAARKHNIEVVTDSSDNRMTV